LGEVAVGVGAKDAVAEVVCVVGRAREIGVFVDECFVGSEIMGGGGCRGGRKKGDAEVKGDTHEGDDGEKEQDQEERFGGGGFVVGVVQILEGRGAQFGLCELVEVEGGGGFVFVFVEAGGDVDIGESVGVRGSVVKRRIIEELVESGVTILWVGRVFGRPRVLLPRRGGVVSSVAIGGGAGGL